VLDDASWQLFFGSSHISASESAQSELNCVDACALFQSKCSSHIMRALTAGCPSTPSCAGISWQDTESLFIAEI